MENNFKWYPFAGKLEIPKIFFDSLTDKPFTNCSMCNCDLISGTWTYVIEKVFRRNVISGKMEVIFEYAVCIECARKLIDSYSKESMERMQEYFKNLRLMDDEANIPLVLNTKQDMDNHLSKCSFTGKLVEEMEEYQMAAQFSGNHFSNMSPPYIFGGHAMEDVMDLLSEKTLGEIDDFTGKYLSGPPEFRDFFKTQRRRPILI